MRTYEKVLDLLIEATERFYMLTPRCLPLLACTECLRSLEFPTRPVHHLPIAPGSAST